MDFNDEVVLLGHDGPGHMAIAESRYRFRIGAKALVNAWSKAGPAHQCAIGLGHIAHRRDKLAALLGVECQRVC